MTKQEKQEIKKAINEMVNNTINKFNLSDPKVRKFIDREFQKFANRWENQKRRLKYE